ncbi:MAG: hypothetical protein ABSE76_00365 [Minisyncoccia bacterium]
MKKLLTSIATIAAATLFLASAGLASASSVVPVYNLQPSWTAVGGVGVWAAYYAPDSQVSSGISPGTTAIYDGRAAGVIKAGITAEPSGPNAGHYMDEGLLGFQVPNVSLSSFASQTLTYDVDKQTGTNPVWVRIRLTDTNQTEYQFIPTTNPAGWHTVDAAAGQWQLMDANGDGTGPMMTLAQVAAANPGLAVDRVYLTLGMGDSYNVSPGVGTEAWVDTVTVGGTTYDFALSAVTVTIDKFIDGHMATAASANNSAFPMVSSWTNAPSYGSGNYDLGTDDSYQAVTSSMNGGASYTTNEVTAPSSVVGTDCTTGDPYALVGYSSGPDLTTAEAATQSLTPPNFTTLTQNEVVIVWNKECLAAPTPLAPANGTITTTAGFTSVSWNSVTDQAGGITYVYQSSNSSATKPDGSFVTPAYTSGSLTATNIPTSGTPAGTYYWHVQAKDADGNVSPWSTMWSVTVINTPAVITNPATNVTATDATLNGVNEGNGAGGHSFWVSLAPFVTTSPTIPAGVYSTPVLPGVAANTAFSDPLSLVTTNGIPGNMPAITPSTKYYYAAWAYIGGTWYPGAVLNFTTLAAPVLLPTPVNACSNLTSPPANYVLKNGVAGNGTYALAPYTMFVGKAGNYTVTGSGGDYIICLPNGNGTVNLGYGNDTVVTGNGNQNITVGAGNSVITTGNGNSKITAGAGNDTITVGNGNNTIIAGGGASICHVGKGLNSITGCTH